MKASVEQVWSPACEFSLVISLLMSLVYIYVCIFINFREMFSGLAAASCWLSPPAPSPGGSAKHKAQSPALAVACSRDCVCQPLGLEIKTTPCCPSPAAFAVFCVVGWCPEAQTLALASVLQHFTESHAKPKGQLPGLGAIEAACHIHPWSCVAAKTK